MTTKSPSGSGRNENDKRPDDNNDQSRGRSGSKQEDPKKREEVDETIRTIEISGFKSYMQARSKPAKIFWLTLLLACTAILIYQLYKTIDNYINSPIVSTYTITTVPEMKFPIVYLCPTNFVNNEYMAYVDPKAEKKALHMKRDMGLVWDYVKFLAAADLSEPFHMSNNDQYSHLVPSAFEGMTTAKSSQFDYNYTDADETWNDTIQHSQDPQEFFFNATRSLEDQIRHCEFRIFIFEEIECANITREVLDPEYGKCYVLDVDWRNQTVQSQGLLLVFNVEAWTYPRDSPLTPVFNGIVVGIEREYNVRGSGERIFIHAGTYNRIDLALQQQQFMSFDHPYKQKCSGSDDFKYEIFKVNYTQRSCGYDCVARALKEKCDCLPPVDRSLYRPEILKNNSQDFCMGRHLSCIREKVHGDKEVSDKIEQCRQQCNVPCQDWRYDVRATSMDLYKPSFYSWQNTTDITYLLVAYSHMEYTQFTQAPSTTVDEMIANIGGEIGLWLGASMMTLIQLPLSVITFCGLCCVKRAKQTATVVKERRKSMYPNAAA